jgi:predicted hotdog family 3-hydroxylacyl-ACP dehydratase
LTHDHGWIAAHIPHQGNMCLLDEVLSWDEQKVICRSNTHRAQDNPLRAHGRLGAACAIEYAAQAMAVHGALLQPGCGVSAGFGLLTSAREVELLVTRLDDLPSELRISAQRLHSDSQGALYSFALHAGNELLVRGRASLLLNPAHLSARTPASPPEAAS